MTDAEIFHDFTLRNDLGPRFDRTRMSPEKFAASYGRILETANGMIASARVSCKKPVPEIYFDFTHNPSVNAFAFKKKEKYFIGFNTGTWFMLHLICLRLLSDGRLFDFIGTPSAEEMNLPPLAYYSTNAQKMAEAGINFGIPRTSERREYASQLFHNVVSFLVGHEIAHITRGHIDYMISKTGVPVISEYGAFASAIPPNADWSHLATETMIERQAIEADADKRSVLFLMGVAKHVHGRVPRNNGNFMEKRRSVENVLFDVSVAINTFFRIFGDIHVREYEISSSFYPQTPIRRYLAMLVARQYLIHNWKPQLSNNVTENALKNGALYPETAFQIMTGVKQANPGFHEAFGRNGIDYANIMDAYWMNTLGRKLADFSYEFDPSEIAAPQSETPVPLG
jgi:hypothetical protein